MKKRGARIKHNIALKPLGMRDMQRYELPTRSALVAIEAGVVSDTNIAHLYSLADMSERMTKEKHIFAHCATIKRLCEQIHNDGGCNDMIKSAMHVSVNLVMDWLNKRSNAEISKAAQDAIRSIDDKGRIQSIA